MLIGVPVRPHQDEIAAHRFKTLFATTLSNHCIIDNSRAGSTVFPLPVHRFNMRAAAGGSASATIYSNNVLIQISLLLLWTALTFFWSIFTPPDKTFAARVILFQPLWILRIWKSDTSLLNDLFLFEVLHAAYSYYAGAWQLPSLRESAWLHHRNFTQQIYLEIFALLGICGLFAGGIVIRGKILAPEEPQDPYRGQCIDDQVLPPLLLTSRTTHSRIFPRKNSFSSNVLLTSKIMYFSCTSPS